MKKIFITILLLCNAMAFSQDCDQIIGEAGIRIPFGTLADKTGLSPEFGIWSRSGVTDCRGMFDIGMSFYIPTNRQEFDYAANDSIYRVKAKGVSGMAGIRMAKDYVIGDKLEVQWLSAFGYAFFMYDDKPGRQGHSNHRHDEGNASNAGLKGLSTFHIGQGIRFGYSHFGFHINYNYTPYGMFSNYVPKDFGSHSLSIAIVYRTKAF